MIIDCISDLHGYYPELQGGDLLIVAGDLTASDEFCQYTDFFRWLLPKKYTRKILVAGNHDGMLRGLYRIDGEETDLSYLCDSGTEFEGLKIWGSPYTPTFGNWHFMEERGEAIKKHWDLIPDDIDILITHGPPYGYLDEVDKVTKRGTKKLHTGCEELAKALSRVKPKLHVFGHIHEGYGIYRPILEIIDCPGYPIFINASHVNERYQPVNAPIRVIL